MFEYRTHNALVMYLIENQEKYFDFKIIRGESHFACYKEKVKTRIGKYKFCDAIGVSEDTIYIIEVKTDKIMLKNIKEYAEYIKYFIYSFKKIKVIFVAPKITKGALDKIERYDNMEYKLINDVYLNKELEKEKMSGKYVNDDFQYQVLWYINKKLRPYLGNISSINKVSINESENQFIEIEFYFSKNHYRIQVKFNEEYNRLNCLFQIIRRDNGSKEIIVHYQKIENVDYVFRVLESEKKMLYVYGREYRDSDLSDNDMATIVKLADSIHHDYCRFDSDCNMYINRKD